MIFDKYSDMISMTPISPKANMAPMERMENAVPKINIKPVNSKENSVPKANMAPMENMMPKANMAPMENMMPKANMAPMENMMPKANMAPMENMMPKANMAPMENMMPKAMANALCVPQETVINNVQLARAYVPFEKMCSTFTPLSGLRSGTIFPPLMEVSGWERSMMGVTDDD